MLKRTFANEFLRYAKVLERCIESYKKYIESYKKYIELYKKVYIESYKKVHRIIQKVYIETRTAYRTLKMQKMNKRYESFKSEKVYGWKCKKAAIVDW